jgi:hypothetical protein
METVSDRVMKRRMYLWKKGKAYTASAFFALLVLAAFQPFLWRALFGPQVLHPLLLHLPNFLKLSVSILSVLLLVTGAVGFVVRCTLELKKGAVLPYVPPVSCLSAGPAGEDVLLRASTEGAVSSQELLRVAAASQHVPDDQLLRVSAGSAQER